MGAIHFSCTEQMVVIPEFSDQCTDKVILIEELSGASCPNCPRATGLLNEISAQYPGKLVIYAIHGDNNAEPLSNSKYDFRSPVGEEQEDFLAPWIGKPSASVDRILYEDLDDMRITSHRINQWLTMIERRCQTPKSVELSVESSFDPDKRVASIEVTVTGVLQVEGELRMNVVIAESKLVDPQDAGIEGIIDDYEHNHVFRDRLSELTGDVFASDLSVGQSFTRSYTYTVPDQHNGEWNADNMEVIGFVTEGGQERGPVLQAAKTDLR